MSKKQYSFILVLIVISGFVGGAFSGWLFSGKTAFAEKNLSHEKVVRAEKFELVTKSGIVLAKFEIEEDREPKLTLLGKGTGSILDSGHLSIYKTEEGAPNLHINNAGIAVRSDKSKDLMMLGSNGNGSFLSLNPLADNSILLSSTPSYSALLIGTKNTSTFMVKKSGNLIKLVFDDKDGKGRLRIRLDEDPSIIFSDKYDNVRAVLGLLNGAPSIGFVDANGQGIWGKE